MVVKINPSYECRTEEDYVKLVTDVCNFFSIDLSKLERDLQEHLEVNSRRMGINSRNRIEKDLYRISQMKGKQTGFT